MSLNSIVEKIVRNRSKIVVSRVIPYISKSEKVIDIGSGSGDVALLLRSQGVDITPVDIGDFHGPRLIKTIIYDGYKLPFSNKSFDIALVLMVLHHTPDPEPVLSEAVRVAKKIVLIETSYTTQVSKLTTVITDTICNLRLNWYWNSYKTDEEWRKLFNKLGLKVIESRKYTDKNLGLPFLHILYLLLK